MLIPLWCCVQATQASDLPISRIFSAPDLSGPSLRSAQISPDGQRVTYLQGKATQPPHEMLFWRFGDQHAARKGDMKLVRYDATGTHLYNLKDDIGESKNLAAERPEVLREMQKAWTEWDRSNVAPLWGGGKKVMLD